MLIPAPKLSESFGNPSGFLASNCFLANTAMQFLNSAVCQWQFPSHFRPTSSRNASYFFPQFGSDTLHVNNWFPVTASALTHRKKSACMVIGFVSWQRNIPEFGIVPSILRWCLDLWLIYFIVVFWLVLALQWFSKEVKMVLSGKKCNKFSQMWFWWKLLGKFSHDPCTVSCCLLLARNVVANIYDFITAHPSCLMTNHTNSYNYEPLDSVKRAFRDCSAWTVISR